MPKRNPLGDNLQQRGNGYDLVHGADPGVVDQKYAATQQHPWQVPRCRAARQAGKDNVAHRYPRRRALVFAPGSVDAGKSGNENGEALPWRTIWCGPRWLAIS